MKRLQRTHELLAQLGAEQRRGFDAAELAAHLGALRHNVSADLNELWRQGLLVKDEGRPVRYWAREIYERVRGSDGSGLSEPGIPGHTVAASCSEPAAPADDLLSQTIGAQESLRQQVEQAKAAVLYPPSGLHTLLVGPTGAGKSRMAELMHAFGVAAGRFPPHAPFVTLNCADYAANPGLLMAHLFGAVKGAYTGAEKEREGLVDQADGGILFLDEVHRLPAEGQEMLFRLIDKGLYRRLGDAGPERKATVMLVAATTERLDSSLLRTFTRRIPMVIAMPSLAERTSGERLKFIRLFLQAEAGKIGVDIVVGQDALRMLLEYECLGNVGQLRNDIQLAFARLFLSYLSLRKNPMELLPAHLPEHIHRTVPPVRHRNPEVTDLLQAIGGRLFITLAVSGQHLPEPDDEPLSFYALIERQLHELQARGLPATEAERRVQENIERHFHDFVEQVRRRHQIRRQELSKLVGAGILRAVERAVLWAEDRLNRAIPERILYALALHIHASLERVQQGRAQENLVWLPLDDSPETQTATGLVELLGRELGCALPDSDVAFVTMLLRPENDSPPGQEKVGVVVMAHGRGVAAGMVDVAHALAGISLATAIDMPLDEEPAAVAERLGSMAAEGAFPGGLLLLVDMGSLESIGHTVHQQSGIPVRTISMVSPPVVIEAVHQASIPGATLDQVYQAVLTDRELMLGRESGEELPQVILTFCFTGVGSAHTLARIVKEALQNQARRVDVIPTSIGAGAGWGRMVATLLQSHRLLATVGPINPHIPGVPYVSTEEVVVGKGGRRLRQLALEGAGCMPGTPPEAASGEAAGGNWADEEAAGGVIFAQMALSLGEHLKVTNPAATVPVIAKGLNAVEQYLGRALSDELRVGLMMHLVCLVDRKVGDRLLKESPGTGTQTSHAGRLPWLPEVLRELTAMFHIRFTPEELARLDEIICQRDVGS